ncbi:XdhC family protein [Psychrobacter sp. ANT_H56B]|uniref:XdhC family protein n=1 Tax=Psychrobacter sp. ANT_H56B TaxID=2597353 RepID=UPI0011F1EA1B|nr:XdhC/CoxI family protein [Psychrobacter sp. ANT_H56B]KAA0928973.1 XdhC family protein [Psychrobacter sp. ANT_H56B]
MNQAADILDLAAQAIQQNIDAVLATVVRTEGSAYRQPGAMMLICADGRSVGMISGGCLEPHIIKRAFWLTRHGASVQIYQTGDDIGYHNNGDPDSTVVEEGTTVKDEDRSEDDFLEGELNFGLGCNGRIHVLFERLATAIPLLDLIRQVRNTQQPATIATLIRSDGSENGALDLQVGSRIYLNQYLKTGNLADVYLNRNMISDSNTFIDDMLLNTIQKLSNHKFHKKNAEYIKLTSDLELQATGDRQHESEWLLQRIYPQTRLLICGAGNDVIPLVTMAKLQDWHVTVIDSRPQYATRLRFSQADSVLCVDLDDSETLLNLSAGAAVAVMSHSLAQDRARLAVLLEHSAQYRYLGQLGPRYRTERLIKEISETSANPHILADGIRKLHYPIGYKLGRDGPEALALSIMAQMSAVIHGHAPQTSLPNSQYTIQTSEQSVFNNYKNDYAHD